jgi:hypothetical protein
VARSKRRRPVRPLRTRARRRELGQRSQQARAHALDALNLMRSRHYSLARAAKEAATTPRTALRYVASALRREASGRYRARPSDRLLRRLHFLTPEGPIVLDVRGSSKASLIARYSSAVDRYLKTGRAEALAEFQGKTVMVGKIRHPFLTDLRTLERLAHAGEVSFEDLYAVTG